MCVHSMLTRFIQLYMGGFSISVMGPFYSVVANVQALVSLKQYLGHSDQKQMSIGWPNLVLIISFKIFYRR